MRSTSARALVRYGYVPLMLIGLNAVAIAMMQAGVLYRYLAIVIVVAIAASFLAERIAPVHEEWNQSGGDSSKDVAHAIVYQTGNLCALLTFPILAHLTHWEGIWPHYWPFVLQVLLAIFLTDFAFTTIHMISHRVPWLWRLHSIHHGVSRLYGFNGFVRHPLHQFIDQAFGVLPLVLAGMPPQVTAALGIAITIQLTLQHSNVDHVLGPFRNWLSIGHIHRLHHTAWGSASDVNFGLFLTIWDRIYGTLHVDSARPVRADDLGIDDEPNFPKTYLDQLVHPFRRKSDASGQRTTDRKPDNQSLDGYHLN